MTPSKPIFAASALTAILAAGGAYLAFAERGTGLPAVTQTPEAAAARAERCAAIRASVEAAGFAETVAVTCDERQAHLASDTYPDHTMMTGIVGTNEQVPVPAKDYAAPVALEPVLGDTPQTRDSSLAVAR